MPGAMRSWVVLIRGIGPTTHRKMSMQDLRQACELAGMQDVSTYIASGNLLLRSDLAKPTLHATLQDILARYGLSNDIILRRRSELKAVVAAQPHPEAAAARPNLLLVVFFNRKLRAGAIDELASREQPEKLQALDRELCVDYRDGVARSRLTPALIDRVMGQAGTARNWNTLNKLIELSAR